MVTFSSLDIIVVLLFFLILLLVGILSSRKLKKGTENYLLYGRKVGLLLFVFTTVSAWYGGILGVGEFTYRFGVASWLTQGFPYYVFAIIFAFFFAKKIRSASLYTIPDKLESVYGRKIGVLSSIIVFLLVSPAPYLLMVGSLVSLIFHIKLIWGLLIGTFVSIAYLFKGGLKATVYTDAFQFFVMFGGFILIFVFALVKVGGLNYLTTNLPARYLKPTGGASPVYILIWFFIALWTFADPGFHQRCYAAKTGNIAKWGIVISVFFWMLFDFLTTSTGLFARALLPNLSDPVLSFPLLAEKILGPGFKGIFYAALFATILSTLNSFMFLSATTIGRDFFYRLSKKRKTELVENQTKLGLIITSVLAIILAISINSVIDIWYAIGSICIPGIIFLIAGAYYPKLKVNNKIAVYELISAVILSLAWYLIRPLFKNSPLHLIEPMIVGLIVASAIHLFGIWSGYRRKISIES